MTELTKKKMRDSISDGCHIGNDIYKELKKFIQNVAKITQFNFYKKISLSVINFGLMF